MRSILYLSHSLNLFISLQKDNYIKSHCNLSKVFTTQRKQLNIINLHLILTVSVFCCWMVDSCGITINITKNVILSSLVWHHEISLPFNRKTHDLFYLPILNWLSSTCSVLLNSFICNSFLQGFSTRPIPVMLNIIWTR